MGGFGLSWTCFLVMLSAFASAFAIGNPSAVNLYLGEASKETSFSILNKGEGAGDVVVEVIIEEGGEYLQLNGDSRYSVPGGQCCFCSYDSDCTCRF